MNLKKSIRKCIMLLGVLTSMVVLWTLQGNHQHLSANFNAFARSRGIDVHIIQTPAHISGMIYQKIVSGMLESNK